LACHDFSPRRQAGLLLAATQSGSTSCDCLAGNADSITAVTAEKGFAVDLASSQT
jgi:hypothetical protein